jgi:hypothetical protein
MGILDDFTMAQVGPLLVPGEQVLGMGYATEWGSKNSRGLYAEEPRLCAATDRRLLLLHTELSNGAVQPQNRGLTEWWFEDIMAVQVMNENQRPLAENMLENWLQFSLAAKPGCGPQLQGDGARITVYGAANTGFANPISLRAQFVPWLTPRVQGNQFPPSPERAAAREARARTQQAAAAQQLAASDARKKAASAALPLRVAYAGAVLCVVMTLLYVSLIVASIGKLDDHETAAASHRKSAAATKDAAERARQTSDAKFEDEMGDRERTTLVLRALGGAAFLAGSVGLVFVIRRLRRKAAAA